MSQCTRRKKTFQVHDLQDQTVVSCLTSGQVCCENRTSSRGRSSCEVRISLMGLPPAWDFPPAWNFPPGDAEMELGLFGEGPRCRVIQLDRNLQTWCGARGSSFLNTQLMTKKAFLTGPSGCLEIFPVIPKCLDNQNSVVCKPYCAMQTVNFERDKCANPECTSLVKFWF